MIISIRRAIITIGIRPQSQSSALHLRIFPPCFLFVSLRFHGRSHRCHSFHLLSSLTVWFGLKPPSPLPSVKSVFTDSPIGILNDEQKILVFAFANYVVIDQQVSLFTLESVHNIARDVRTAPGSTPLVLQSGLLRPDFHRVSSSLSIVASILYPASPIDPALKSTSSTHQTPELSRFDSPSADSAAQPSSSTGADTHRPFSSTLSDLSSIGKINSAEYEDGFSSSVSGGTSLPALAALASVASAPTSNLRYVSPQNGMCDLVA